MELHALILAALSNALLPFQSWGSYSIVIASRNLGLESFLTILKRLFAHVDGERVTVVKWD